MTNPSIPPNRMSQLYMIKKEKHPLQINKETHSNNQSNTTPEDNQRSGRKRLG